MQTGFMYDKRRMMAKNHTGLLYTGTSRQFGLLQPQPIHSALNRTIHSVHGTVYRI